MTPPPHVSSRRYKLCTEGFASYPFSAYRDTPCPKPSLLGWQCLLLVVDCSLELVCETEAPPLWYIMTSKADHREVCFFLMPHGSQVPWTSSLESRILLFALLFFGYAFKGDSYVFKALLIWQFAEYSLLGRFQHRHSSATALNSRDWSARRLQ